ncbi:unnamed protein product [Moneuplotes crassus]|uniref:Uncharacterized protein n=1 Tax=Euplotes crassus TaxID=5936 RepID=A0AAD1XJ04_EUPCR|nr:unnamed protein product [Moneuplotes crassus]
MAWEMKTVSNHDVNMVPSNYLEDEESKMEISKYNPIKRSAEESFLSVSKDTNPQLIEKSNDVKLLKKKDISDGSYSSDIYENILKSTMSFASSGCEDDATKSEIQMLKFSRIMDDICKESDKRSPAEIFSSNAKSLNIVSEMQRFIKNGYFEGIEDWEQILASLKDLHKRRLEIYDTNQKEFKDKYSPRRGVLDLLQKDIKRVKELKDSYLEEHKHDITDSTDLSATPYFSRGGKSRIFQILANESELMEKEYLFLHKKYKKTKSKKIYYKKELNQSRNVIEQMTNEAENLQKTINSLAEEKELLMQQIFELKGGKSSANLISRLFKGKRK